jgi:DNA-binding YbaB/EbfC family protein
MNPKKAMKQIQEMQERMQRELEEVRVSASSGGEMVTITMNGKKDVLGIKIDPQVVSADDVEMLQDLLVAALSECSRKVDDQMSSKLQSLTGGLNIPGLGF